MNMNSSLIGPGSMDPTFGNLRSLSEERDIGSIMSRGIDMIDLNPTSLTTSINNSSGKRGCQDARSPTSLTSLLAHTS